MHFFVKAQRKRFLNYYANITEQPASKTGGYQGEVECLNKEFQSLERQERIKQLPDFLTFGEFVEDDGTKIELKKALDRLKTRLVKLTQQCELAFRGSEHKLSHIRRAVGGHPRSELPLQASPPHNGATKLVEAVKATIEQNATKAALQKTKFRMVDDAPGLGNKNDACY
jgi:hypothetical protein